MCKLVVSEAAFELLRWAFQLPSGLLLLPRRRLRIVFGGQSFLLKIRGWLGVRHPASPGTPGFGRLGFPNSAKAMPHSLSFTSAGCAETLPGEPGLFFGFWGVGGLDWQLSGRFRHVHHRVDVSRPFGSGLLFKGGVLST